MVSFTFCHGSVSRAFMDRTVFFIIFSVMPWSLLCSAVSRHSMNVLCRREVFCRHGRLALLFFLSSLGGGGVSSSDSHVSFPLPPNEAGAKHRTPAPPRN